MVLRKRSDYGFLGYQVPRIPRATRSARRRGSFRRKTNDNPMCAFDLLATVAGNLLLEKESTSPSSGDAYIKKEPHIEDCKPLKGETSFVFEPLSRAPICHHSSKDLPHVHNDAHSGIASVLTSSDCSEKFEDLKNVKDKILLGGLASKLEDPCNCVLDDGIKEHVKVELPKTEKGLVSAAGNMRNSDIRVESKEYISSESLPVGGRDGVKLGIRDDDENSSRCTKFGTGTKAFRPSPRVGDRRIRKLLASKYWKVASNSKEGTNNKTDSEMKPSYQCRKNCHKRQRSQRYNPCKKRKLYNCSSALNWEGPINCGNISSLPRKEFSFDASDSGAKVNGGSGKSACAAGQTSPLQQRDSYVKLRIKSFKVPELLLEIPETATVGFLKRTVMEAVTAVLGGGLRVGVLLKGKKIRDDNRTLQQTGMCHDDMLEALGFSLEPNSLPAPPALQHEDCTSLLSVDTPQQLKSYPHSPRGECSVVQPRAIDSSSDPPPSNLGNFVESDHDSAPSPPDMSPDKYPMPMDSRALVAVPAMNAEALSMVPLKKPKRTDSSQRRIRRPFSVSEVEALVQAVEKLGTGRWRDVKLRAFDNAKHRTYVDLKDKWKTLVHTARISPQQRRGEPVPQELLDRVLTAHAYWSQQQANQQLKHHPETCRLP